MPEGICEETGGSPLPEKIHAERVHITDVLLFEYHQNAECEVGGEDAHLDREAHYLVRRSRDTEKYSLALEFCSCGGRKGREGKENFVSGVVGGRWGRAYD